MMLERKYWSIIELFYKMFQSRETKENLEQCEKMYIDKFREHIKRDNKQYSDFMRSLCKKNMIHFHLELIIKYINYHYR